MTNQDGQVWERIQAYYIHFYSVFRSGFYYLHIDLFVLVTGDGHEVRPVCGFHHHTSQLCAGDVEGRGAVLVRTLDTRPADLLRGLVTKDTLLRADKEKHCHPKRKFYIYTKAKEVSLLINLNYMMKQLRHYYSNGPLYSKWKMMLWVFYYSLDKKDK